VIVRDRSCSTNLDGLISFLSSDVRIGVEPHRSFTSFYILN